MCIPACLAGFQAHTKGSLRGLALGGGLQAHTQGEVEGSGLGGLQAHTHGVLQAHTQGVSPGPHRWGSPDPHQGGVSRFSHWGVSPGPHLGGIPACTEADPPRLTATAAGSVQMHPTGMHSCSYFVLILKFC